MGKDDDKDKGSNRGGETREGSKYDVILRKGAGSDKDKKEKK